MKALRIVALVLAGIVGLVLIVAAFLPSHVVVKRSISIGRNPEQVQAYSSDLKNMMDWSVWAKMDPNQKIDFSTPSSGVGAYWAWDGNETGKGKLTNTKVEPGRVEQDLVFQGEAPAKVWWTFTREGEGTAVEWAFETDMQYPMTLMGPVMDIMLGQSYEEGLKNLKAEVEKLPVSPVAADSAATPVK